MSELWKPRYLSKSVFSFPWLCYFEFGQGNQPGQPHLCFFSVSLSENSIVIDVHSDMHLTEDSFTFRRHFLSQEMMMIETFITTVIEDHCHQRPDKPCHTSTDDGVPDTTANSPRSITPVYSHDAHTARSSLFSPNAVFVNGFWFAFSIADASQLWIRVAPQNYCFLFSHWLKCNVWAHTSNYFPKTWLLPLLYVYKILSKQICSLKTAIIQ